MTGLLTCVLAMYWQSGTVLSFPEPSSDRVTFQVCVELPPLSPRDEAAMQAVADNLFEGTEEYSRPQLMSWGRQMGTEPRSELLPGFLRIGMSFPADQVGVGISMIDSVLRRAQFPEDQLKSWSSKPKAALDDYWGTALWPTRSKVRDLRLSDVMAAYRRYIRPETTRIAMAGQFAPADVAKLESRLEDWLAPRVPRPPTDFNTSAPLLKSDAKVSTVELRLPEFSLEDASFPTKLLAAFALGAGKDASLFRVSREQLRLSYRQEAVLWPTGRGLQVRLISALQMAEWDPEVSKKLKEALLKDVGTWDRSVRDRALGMARASWKLRVGPNPLYLSTRAPLDASLEDRTFLRTFWLMKSGADWNADRLLERMNAVSADELKTEAQRMLEGSLSHAILAQG
jgi:hypothetical protein